MLLWQEVGHRAGQFHRMPFAHPLMAFASMWQDTALSPARQQWAHLAQNFPNAISLKVVSTLENINL